MPMPGFKGFFEKGLDRFDDHTFELSLESQAAKSFDEKKLIGKVLGNETIARIAKINIKYSALGETRKRVKVVLEIKF